MSDSESIESVSVLDVYAPLRSGNANRFWQLQYKPTLLIRNTKSAYVSPGLVASHWPKIPWRNLKSLGIVSSNTTSHSAFNASEFNNYLSPCIHDIRLFINDLPNVFSNTNLFIFSPVAGLHSLRTKILYLYTQTCGLNINISSLIGNMSFRCSFWKLRLCIIVFISFRENPVVKW